MANINSLRKLSDTDKTNVKRGNAYRIDPRIIKIRPGHNPCGVFTDNYWKKRLINRTYDRLIITRGYPRKDDNERILTMHYRGYEIKTINHEFFGNNPVKVFAIKLEVQPS